MQKAKNVPKKVEKVSNFDKNFFKKFTQHWM